MNLANNLFASSCDNPASDHRLRHLLLGVEFMAFGKLTAMRVLAEMTLYSHRVPPMMGGST
jgi:hypothetical protein